MVELDEKAKVTLLTVGSQQVLGTYYLLRNLERHGVESHLMLKPLLGSIAETILSTAQELPAGWWSWGHSSTASSVMMYSEA